ncbi:unnamed protein product [Timema podura]|uniref:Uncharacterized protein n=1 Tax=Timema podura TaxID=61482 RepID=A0ABN7NIX1_TIMPD|nr:unnamed protein product [Timema podura]
MYDTPSPVGKRHNISEDIVVFIESCSEFNEQAIYPWEENCMLEMMIIMGVIGLVILAIIVGSTTRRHSARITRRGASHTQGQEAFCPVRVRADTMKARINLKPMIFQPRFGVTLNVRKEIKEGRVTSHAAVFNEKQSYYYDGQKL